MELEKQIEELELKYLNKYYFFLRFTLDEILEGLKTRDKIAEDWKGLYGTNISDFSTGAERVIYALLNGKGIGTPNSAPVGSDLFFEVKDKFNTIINSESLQYIDLQTAFNIIPKILSKNGKWIVIDYFRINRNGINKSGHFHDDFLECVKKNGWKITHQKDITKNALPTLKFAMTFINRFVKPITIFASEKLKYKKGWIYYLTKELRINMTKKADKELAALNPENFIKEKKYILYVLERQ